MDIFVTSKNLTDTTGILRLGEQVYDCTLGRGGMILPEKKVEGDGTTPIGIFPLREVFYRQDRIAKPETGLPLRPLLPDDGWCEDPTHPDYNKHVKLPHASVHDHMTREDHVYDIVVVIGYNDDPPVQMRGSAIFMHLARPDFSPTAGCVGLAYENLLKVLKSCDLETKIHIHPV